MQSVLAFNPPLIAHRGASGMAPENTLSAFIKAAQLGIKWVEFDVMQAACGELVVFHDETLNRTTNGQGLLANHPYHYLRTLDAGAWFDLKYASEPIPTLRQVLDFLQRFNMSANIEIKPAPGQEEALVLRTLKLVADFFPITSPRILFSSFSQDTLKYLRKYAPDCLLGLLLEEWVPHWETIHQQLNCISTNVNHEIMTSAYAARIKDMNSYLLCYTVNDPARAKTLFSWGIDAVFTDQLTPTALTNLAL